VVPLDHNEYGGTTLTERTTPAAAPSATTEQVLPEQRAVEETLVARVLASFDGTPDPRLRKLMQAKARLRFARTWHRRGLGLNFRPCKATRCQKQIAEVAKALYQRTDEPAVLLARRSPAVVGAEALPQIACTLSSIDVYSAWMSGCLQ
jgi:hypothetical protein